MKAFKLSGARRRDFKRVLEEISLLHDRKDAVYGGRVSLGNYDLAAAAAKTTPARYAIGRIAEKVERLCNLESWDDEREELLDIAVTAINAIVLGDEDKDG